MKNDDRRRVIRFRSRVLANCLPPGRPRKRDGHTMQHWEMWACDMGDDGVRLEWSEAWANRAYIPDFRIMDERPAPRRLAVQAPVAFLKKGTQVRLEGLVYGDHGPKSMRGRIKWAKGDK